MAPKGCTFFRMADSTLDNCLQQLLLTAHCPYQPNPKRPQMHPHSPSAAISTLSVSPSVTSVNPP